VKAKIRNFQQSTKFASEELVDDGIYFKRAKSSIRSQFVCLTQGSFEENLRYRWSKISEAEVVNGERKARHPNSLSLLSFLFTSKEIGTNSCF